MCNDAFHTLRRKKPADGMEIEDAADTYVRAYVQAHMDPVNDTFSSDLADAEYNMKRITHDIDAEMRAWEEKAASLVERDARLRAEITRAKASYQAALASSQKMEDGRATAAKRYTDTRAQQHADQHSRRLLGWGIAGLLAMGAYAAASPK